MYRIASTMLMLPPVALIILLLSSSPKLLADAAHAQSFCSNANAMYTRDDTYRSNLIDLANELIANATGNQKSHLATSTAGTGPGKVYGAAICRGDSTGKACADRLQKALDKATSNNSSIVTAASKNVTLFDDDYQAQLIFSDEDFISSFISNSPECTVRAYLNTPPNTVDPELFTKLVTELMEKLTDDAAAAERPGRYSTGQGWLDEKSQAVYGLAQCTEDMSPESCRSCLAGVTAEVKGMGESGLTGGAILGVRCSMWYQTDIKFFSADPMVSLHMPTPSKFWIWVTIGSFSLIASISWLLVHIWIKTERKREQARHKARLLSMAIQNVINLWRIEEGNSGFSLYDFTQIKEATQNFSAENKLGQGGFGPVYKGLLPGGLEVAVKRLAACSVQGLLEFKNEIQLIAKLQHKNLVRLLGCCIEGDQEKILVYEYLHNKSLDIFIFDCAKGAQLNWSKRQRIIDGIAQGILYLHNHSRLCVVHRDLKASNILLDSDMAPKISDFGMARIFCSNMTESNTTRIVGTHGYISPEYAFDGVCSIKSDVFSFGVLVVEIISGKRTTSFYPYDGKLYNLISYAWQLWRSGRWQELVCCSIGQNHQVIQRCIQVALLCVQERADDRPTIDQVLTMLNSEEMTLPKPNQPAYFFVRSTASEVSSSDSSITITLAR